MTSCARHRTLIEGDRIPRALAAIDVIVTGGQRR